MLTRTIYCWAILNASLWNNLFIPFAIYIYKYGLFNNKPKNFIGCNAWGIVMDGVLAGAINITTFNLLLEIKPEVAWSDIKIAFLLGFCSMLAAHAHMAVYKWKIWIMPRPWQWNSAGYWHMVSMTLQMSFLAYPVVLILKNPTLLTLPVTQVSLVLISLLTILFALSLYLCSRGLTIGKFHLSNKPW